MVSCGRRDVELHIWQSGYLHGLQQGFQSNRDGHVSGRVVFGELHCGRTSQFNRRQDLQCGWLPRRDSGIKNDPDGNGKPHQRVVSMGTISRNPLPGHEPDGILCWHEAAPHRPTGPWIPLAPGTTYTDRAFLLWGYPAPWTPGGTIEWDIQVGWRVLPWDNGLTLLSPGCPMIPGGATETCELGSDGTVTISKLGCSAIRQTNGTYLN